MNAEVTKKQYDQGLISRDEALHELACVTGFTKKEAAEFLDGLRGQALQVRAGFGNLLIFSR